MTVTLAAEVTVSTADLRDALRAVTPHAEQLKTGDLDAEHRVRLVLDAHHVNVLASNSSTAAMAIVSIEDDTRNERFAADDGPLTVDITPRQARLILQQFKAKGTDPEGVEQLLSVTVGAGLVTLTDKSGLFAGETVSFPDHGVADGFPDVMGIIQRALAAASSSQGPKPLTADGKTLALFKPASVVYGQPLVVEATGTVESRGFLVSCGESFLGVVSSRHQDDDSLKRRDAWRTAWMRRLGLDRQLAAV